MVNTPVHAVIIWKQITICVIRSPSIFLIYFQQQKPTRQRLSSLLFSVEGPCLKHSLERDNGFSSLSSGYDIPFTTKRFRSRQRLPSLPFLATECGWMAPLFPFTAERLLSAKSILFHSQQRDCSAEGILLHSQQKLWPQQWFSCLLFSAKGFHMEHPLQRDRKFFIKTEVSPPRMKENGRVLPPRIKERLCWGYNFSIKKGKRRFPIEKGKREDSADKNGR